MSANTCDRCAEFELDLAAERQRADRLLAELAVRPATCDRCASLAAELAEALRDRAHLRQRLREWDLAAAVLLDGRDEVQP